MKRRQKNIARTLLCVFLSIAAIPLFLPDAPPVAPDEQVQLVQFEDADNSGENGLLRSATESCEESTREDDFTFISFIQDFHSASIKIRLAKSVAYENARRPVEIIYLRHSRFLI